MIPSLPTSQCPVCHYELDCAKSPEHPLLEPNSGDISVCLNCGEILQFNDILVLKPASNLQLTEEQEAMLMEAVLLIKQRGRFR